MKKKLKMYRATVPDQNKQYFSMWVTEKEHREIAKMNQARKPYYFPVSKKGKIGKMRRL